MRLWNGVLTRLKAYWILYKRVILSLLRGKEEVSGTIPGAYGPRHARPAYVMTANATEKNNSVIVETGFIGNLKRDILLSAADDVAHFCPARRDFGPGKRRQATFLRDSCRASPPSQVDSTQSGEENDEREEADSHT